MLSIEDWEIESAAARERLRAQDRRYIRKFQERCEIARMGERMTKLGEFPDASPRVYDADRRRTFGDGWPKDTEAAPLPSVPYQTT